METSGEYREGFLCPICMEDLGTVSQLTEHFERDHANEDKDVVNQLKSLFGKAKKTILRKESNVMESSPSLSGPSYAPGGIDPTMWEPQKLGAVRSHTMAFCTKRDARIDRYAVETNKLLIRLDKLLSEDLPTDPSKRKVYEKKVVNWAPDKDMNICTSCGKGFGFTRRRHHCRLCGTIMCNKCSQFLPFTYATKLTNPGFHPEGGVGFLRRSNSNTSLNSMMTPDGEPHLRTCNDCRMLLERRDQLVQQRTTKTDIVQLYEKLRDDIEEVELHLPTFAAMAESLNGGETTYGLHEAKVLKAKLACWYETIERASKRIAGLGYSGQSDNLPPPTQLKLQATVRKMATQFLQDNVIGLHPLPTDEKLKELQAARQAEIQRQIALERQRAIEAQERARQRAKKQADEGKWKEDLKNNLKSTFKRESKPKQAVRPTKGQGKASPGRVPNKGWTPTPSSESTIDLTDTDDPLVQQMIIIKNYIEQAEDAMKLDEVAMLRTNLQELEREYRLQQRQTAMSSQTTLSSNAPAPVHAMVAVAPSYNPFEETVPVTNPFDEPTNPNTNPFETRTPQLT